MNLSIRLSEHEDAKLFKKLLEQPGVLEYFPMYDEREIDDAVRIWEIFCKKGASLTSIIDGKPCGLGYLNLQPYKKFAHQCLITVIVDGAYRNQGIGTALMEELFMIAKDPFHIENLHLEVYSTNPAIRLYQRLGFKEFGMQANFIKEEDKYIGKVYMERPL